MLEKIQWKPLKNLLICILFAGTSKQPIQIKEWVNSEDRENGMSLQTLEVHVVQVDKEEIKQNNLCYCPNLKCGRSWNYRQAFS